jgi:N-acetylmuramoyl-L-alanine amidase
MTTNPTPPTPSFKIDLTSPAQQGEFYDLFLMALCVWREARGESMEGKRAVAWVVRNRADHPAWWGGPSIASVVLHPSQFSSFNHNDPNSSKLPYPPDPGWVSSLLAAQEAMYKTAPDITNGAVDYYDKSMDENPPLWARDGSLVHCGDIDDFHFYRPKNIFTKIDT